MKKRLVQIASIALLFVILFIIATFLKSRPSEKHGMGAIPTSLQTQSQ